MLRTTFGLTFVEAAGLNTRGRSTQNVQTVTDMAIDGSGSLWSANPAVPTLFGWGPAPGHQAIPSSPSAGAAPLNLGVGTGFINATRYRTGFQHRPARRRRSESIVITTTSDAPMADGFLPLVFSSPVQGLRSGYQPATVVERHVRDADEAAGRLQRPSTQTDPWMEAPSLNSPSSAQQTVPSRYVSRTVWNGTRELSQLMQLVDRPDDSGGALPDRLVAGARRGLRPLLWCFAKAGGWGTPPTALDLTSILTMLRSPCTAGWKRTS